MIRVGGARLRPLTISFLAAALFAEFVDELVDGTRGAALPLIRHDLGLTYAQVGLLFAAPLLVGSLIELPLGVAAGYGRRRRRVMLAGGVAFVVSLVDVALSGSFAALLVGFVAFFPASGAFVSLAQAELMDRGPEHRERHMAAWVVSGSVGALAGPAALVAILRLGGSWRATFLSVAAVAGLSVLAAATSRRGASHQAAGEPRRRSSRADVLAALRSPDVVRWLALLQVSDLLLDVLTGFVALYVVDVAHGSPAWGATAVAVRTAAMLAGELALVPVLSRWPGRAALVGGSVVAAAGYPAFLLVPGLGPKLVLLAVVSAATAPWYPVLQAQLYEALDGHSGVAVTLSSASGLAGGLAPLAVGLAAQALGLGPALALLAVVPLILLAGLVGGG